jgi:hypothetical protein
LFGIALQPVEEGKGGIPYYAPYYDIVTLSVVRGKELGGFNLNGGTEKTGSVSLLVPELEYVYFKTNDTLPPGMIQDTVAINIKSYKIDTTVSFPVRACSRGTSFNFSAAKPKIYIRTKDALAVQPVIDNSSTIVWDKNTDPVTFTITAGSEYGSFAINGQKQGSTSVTLQGSQIDGLSFFANDSLPQGVTEGPVSIQASSKGIVKNASLIVQSTSKLKLTLDVSPASIEYGGSTTATAQTVNIDTQAPEAPPGDVTYNFTLTQGSEFARFYQYDGTGGGASGSIASLSKTSSTNQNNSINTHKLKQPRILAKSVSKGLNKSSKDEVKYNIKSLSKATATDNGGPDVLDRVPQSDGNAFEWPEATDQEPVNPEGETVQVVVIASDANIASASGSFLVKSSCIVVSVSPSKIKQGETATVTVKKKSASGALEDLPADAYVEFEITGGANAGQLSSPDGSQTGGYIGGSFQSAIFTAAVDASLPDDNPVRISVYTPYCSGLGKLTVTNDACMQIKHASLSVGDTASLSIVYTESGSPVPADKSLNISISGGAGGENGFLLVGGSIGTSFTGVTQPISYIAPMVIQGDSLVVPIAVSKSESGGGGGIAASFQKKDSLKISLKKNSAISPRIMSECITENVTVKDECILSSDVPRCSGPTTEVPQINIKENENGFAGENVQVCNTNPDEFAFFKPSANQFITPYTIDVCFDENTKNWKYNLPAIQINVIVGKCENKFGQYQVIKSIEEAGMISSKCCANKDFTGLLDQYPILTRKGGYIIYDAIMQHEQVHKADFEKDIVKASEILAALKGFGAMCKYYPTLEKAKEKIEEQVKKTLGYFKDDAINNWCSRTQTDGQEDEAKKLEYEQKTQSDPQVREIIEKYIKALGTVQSDCICY